jgi:sugar phosphate isomerase/epimerase
MKFGFRWWNTEKELEIAKRHGVEVVEVYWAPEWRPRQAELIGLLKKYGIRASVLLTGDDPTPELLKQDLDSTAAFGARAFVTHPHPISLTDPEEHSRFQDLFVPACDYAEQLGVKLAVHSCGLGPEQWDLMFRLVPKLALKYDPSFSLEAGRNYLAEIVKYAPRMVHFHIKDERCMGRDTNYWQGLLTYQYGPAGTGDTNWGAVIALLYEQGYQGDLALETHSQFWWDHFEWDLIISKRHIDQFLVA